MSDLIAALPGDGIGPEVLAQAVRVLEQLPVDVEVGYRWVDVTGNQPMYRTQVNDRQGFLLRSLLYDSHGPLGGLDAADGCLERSLHSAEAVVRLGRQDPGA